MTFAISRMRNRGAAGCVALAAVLAGCEAIQDVTEAPQVLLGRGGPGAAAPNPGGPPPLRDHTVTQAPESLETQPATERPSEPNRFSARVDGDVRVIRTNGIPSHATGSFPNAGNPNAIRRQDRTLRVPASPKRAASPTPVEGYDFGVAVNGVKFDPGAAEFYRGDPNSGWRYEPLSGAIDLGLDENHAHVQPDGAYHYHGLPTLLLEELGVKAQSHSPLVGWAADGYPIYALYGYTDPENPRSPIMEVSSGYEVKFGDRPLGSGNPGGAYDGVFVADYTYVAGRGDLDECNGRFTVTPEFPTGTYAYFLTNEWPVIPRCFNGQPSSDFAKRRPGGPPGAQGEGRAAPGERPPPRPAR